MQAPFLTLKFQPPGLNFTPPLLHPAMQAFFLPKRMAFWRCLLLSLPFAFLGRANADDAAAGATASLSSNYTASMLNVGRAALEAAPGRAASGATLPDGFVHLRALLGGKALAALKGQA